VVENGRIVEMGSHQELMEKNGAYAALVRTQELHHG
jgi:ATP-binding cassette subfamily B protein